MTQTVIHLGVLNMARMWETPARTMGGRWVRWPDAWAADSTLPTRLLNRVTVLRELEAAAAGELVTRVMRFYADRPDGGEYLVNDPWGTLDLAPFGFTRWWSLPFMVRGPADPPPIHAEFEIREVTLHREFEGFVPTLVDGFGIPTLKGIPASRLLDERVLADGAMKCWIGLVDSTPIGTSVALVSDGVVGVYLVSVVPAMRRRGFGEVLTWQATLADHAPATLQASGLGRSVYERMGYVTALECATWIKADRI